MAKVEIKRYEGFKTVTVINGGAVKQRALSVVMYQFVQWSLTSVIIINGRFKEPESIVNTETKAKAA